MWAGSHKDQGMVTGLELSVPPCPFCGGEKGWGLGESSLASELINLAYETASIKTPDGELSGWWIPQGAGHEALHPSSPSWPCASLPHGCSDLYPLQ